MNMFANTKNVFTKSEIDAIRKAVRMYIASDEVFDKDLQSITELLSAEGKILDIYNGNQPIFKVNGKGETPYDFVTGIIDGIYDNNFDGLGDISDWLKSVEII